MNDARLCRLRDNGHTCLGVIISLVVLSGAMDVHAPALNHETFRTPTPVICGGSETSTEGHLEPGAGVLAPAHEPILLKKAKRLPVTLKVNRTLRPPLPIVVAVHERQQDLPQQLFRQPSPARAPPRA